MKSEKKIVLSPGSLSGCLQVFKCVLFIIKVNFFYYKIIFYAIIYIRKFIHSIMILS